MNNRHVGLIGATSLTGVCLQQALIENNWNIIAFSRKPMTGNTAKITWQKLSPYNQIDHIDKKIDLWICVAPIWVLPEYFSLLLTYGIKRIVLLSSTSQITKKNSTDAYEQYIVQQLTEGENQISAWAAANHIEWIILRPTMIYGLGRDKNIAEIARFIKCFHFFPLFGEAPGLRQPIHVGDVASACLLALKALNLKKCTYNLTGGETLTYREMVRRIFITLDKKPYLLTIPLWSFKLAVGFLRFFPRYRNWNSTMAERMNQDLVFDSSELQQQLQFSPRPFILTKEDLP